jgi:hypothetical protein
MEAIIPKMQILMGFGVRGLNEAETEGPDFVVPGFPRIVKKQPRKPNLNQLKCDLIIAATAK